MGPGGYWADSTGKPNFYRAGGFRVILPDNLAEPCDREVCGHPGDDGIDAQTRNLKLRIAQTLPRSPLCAGNIRASPSASTAISEGGYVAQALGEKLAGLIVTGRPVASALRT